MMKTNHLWTRSVVVIFIMIVIGLGCRSAAPPVSFYTLSSIRGAEPQPSQTLPVRDMVVGIGPTRFPDYLDRPQIVTRSGPNKLNMSEFNRWGGKLDQDFLNVFAENISILLSTNKVVILPWKGQASPDYRIALDIDQFEGQMGDSVLLNVTWTIRGRDETIEPLYVKRSIISQPITGQGYDAMVSAYSQAVAELSREVSAAINKIAQ
jgi:uncharacterized lipoprotein YmbA